MESRTIKEPGTVETKSAPSEPVHHLFHSRSGGLWPIRPYAEYAPIVHMQAVLGRPNGTPRGGHVFELNVSPTLEVFMTVNQTPLKKRPHDAFGMKLIDPTEWLRCIPTGNVAYESVCLEESWMGNSRRTFIKQTAMLTAACCAGCDVESTAYASSSAGIDT